ncbi:MAG: YdcF family protein [Micropruina sp.]|nr:MAG: YdcF family protein [Micropruina sp.]
MLRVGLGAVGAGLVGNAVWLAATANWTVGMALVALAGSVVLAWAVWFPRLAARRPVVVATVALAVFVLAFTAFLAVQGGRDDAVGDEDAVIVLGAAVHGRELSNTLVGRLDAALDYHQRNPSALIVVSGGQGFQEQISEASAMRAYLLDHRVADAQVVAEDRSTSTEENFANSRALLDQRLPPGYRVVFVTDEFHVYRAGRIAAAAGLDARHVASRTPWYFAPANYLREIAAVLVNGLR